LIGEFKIGRGEFYGQEIFNGRAIFVRHVWSGISRILCMFDRGLHLTLQAMRLQLAAMPHDICLIRLIACTKTAGRIRDSAAIDSFMKIIRWDSQSRL
jgi:hypothetical protein